MSTGQKPLTEADVLFELFLPLVCEARAEQLERYRGSIEFHLQAKPPRAWSLTGGPRPWLKRGPVEGQKPTLKVTVTERLVKQLVHGKDPDLAGAQKRGDLSVEGDLESLGSLGVSEADFERIVREALKE